MSSPAEFGTPDRIIRMAMMDAGLLQEGSDPNSDQYANGSDRLNDVINITMIKPGCKLWTIIDQPLPLTTGKSLYTLMPGGDVSMAKPAKIESGYYLDSTNVRRPLFPIAWEDWIRLGTVVQQGAVTQYMEDRQTDRINVNLWLTPDANAATGQVHLLLKQQITNFSGIADTMMFPQEWFMYLRWALADDLSSGQPQYIQEKCAQKAQMYYDALSNFDTEGAPVRFEPDMRVGVEGRFN